MVAFFAVTRCDLSGRGLMHCVVVVLLGAPKLYTVFNKSFGNFGSRVVFVEVALVHGRGHSAEIFVFKEEYFVCKALCRFWGDIKLVYNACKGAYCFFYVVNEFLLHNCEKWR